MDPAGFQAPFGPTTAERRHPGFAIAESGDDCQWNGPSWPFATTITLKALANVLNGPAQSAVTAADYFTTLLTYARSQQLMLPDGRTIAYFSDATGEEELYVVAQDGKSTPVKLTSGLSAP